MPAPTPVELAFLKGTTNALTVTTPAFSASAAIGDLVVVAYTNGGWSVASVTDTAGNTYTRTVNFVTGGSVTVMIAWSILTVALTTSDTLSVTTSGGTPAHNISVQKFAGTNVSVDGSSSAGATSTAISSGSTVAAGTDDLLIGVSGINSGGLVAITPAVVSPTWSTFTTDHWFASAAAGGRQFDGYYRDVSGIGSYTYDATIGSFLWAAGIVAFSPPAVAFPTQNQYVRMRART